jgi:hypothetical protein
MPLLLLQAADYDSLHSHQKAVEACVGGFEFAFVGGGAPVVVEQPPESERDAQDGRSGTNNDSGDHQGIEYVLGHGADCSTCWDVLPFLRGESGRWVGLWAWRTLGGGLNFTVHTEWARARRQLRVHPQRSIVRCCTFG